MPQPDETLTRSWDSQADRWVAWTRTPGHDSYDQFHRAMFLPLVPPAGRLTIDLGSGEGRVGRDLQAAGHRVVAIDSSPAMCRATATHPSAPTTALIADAARLPFPDNVADRVVAFMALHDIDDMRGTVAEIARILGPGGVLVLAIVHPVNSAVKYDTELDAHVMRRSWFEERRVSDMASRDGLTMTFHSRHRPLQAYTDALSDAGFLIDRLREPTKEGHRIPWFLHIRAISASGDTTASSDQATR